MSTEHIFMLTKPFLVIDPKTRVCLDSQSQQLQTGFHCDL